MSSKEIKELRQAGKLDEALQMAKQLLEAEPDNIWNKRAISWVYYEYVKKFAQPDSYDLFKENLLKIKDLKLPEDEKMVFDNCAWKIGSMLYSIIKIEPIDYNKINDLFDIVKEFHFTKPSAAYSFVYKSFHKGYHNWSKYLEFADWWSFKNFLPEDYIETDYNGKKVMSLVEQAYIAYSKKILEGTISDILGLQKTVDKEKIKSFLPQLDVIVNEHPEYQYPPYFKAKLLLASGSDKNVLTAFLPFAKQKRNDFWVWELMAEIFADDKELHFACYCKALSCKTPEDFLVKLKQTFAEMLVNKQMYNEARTEIEKSIATRTKHGWKLPYQIAQWIEQDWYKTATAKKDNTDLYIQHVAKAEEILFQDIPEEVIVVEFVNENKSMLTFVKNKEKHGFFNYSRLINKPQIGDVLSVRFNGGGDNNFYKVITAEKTENHIESEAIKKIDGNLKLVSPQNFGFVENIYIDSKLIEKNKLTDGQDVSGKAILSFNKKKNEWGWKAIELK